MIGSLPRVVCADWFHRVGRLHNEDALSNESDFSTQHNDGLVDGIRMEGATASRASSRWQ